jgi:hypothetical protein
MAGDVCWHVLCRHWRLLIIHTPVSDGETANSGVLRSGWLLLCVVRLMPQQKHVLV